MSLSLSSLLIVALSGVAGWLGTKWMFKKDHEVEQRRRAAAELAATLYAVGLKTIPQFLLDYSVGDYSGMARKIADVGKTFLSGEAAVLAEFEDVFSNLLGAKLKTEEGRTYIKAKLAEIEKSAGPSPEPVAK